MRATIQVNENGSWRNVASFDRDCGNTRQIRAALGALADALGPAPKWRIKQEGTLLVLLDDDAIRKSPRARSI